MNDQERTRTPFRITPVVFHVLFSLVDGDAHAYGIMKDVEERTGGSVRIGPGSLHFTLGKLMEAEMISESAERPDPEMDDARRRYYRLTRFGRRVLKSELEILADIVDRARRSRLVPRPGTA